MVGVTELHPHAGVEMPKIRLVQPPAPGWQKLLRQHTRYYVHKVIVPANKLTSHEIKFICAKREDACRMFLSAWPRGSGLGELLMKPLVDDTRVSHRGVCEEWWRAVVARAAFVPTRIFVEAFVKPLTRAARCALWFFVPPQYRKRPEPPNGVFISHAWDLSMWDIRPDRGSIMWLDTIAIVQHRAPVGASALAEEAFPELLELVPTLKAINNTLLILGGGSMGCGPSLLPLGRSWCCFELAHTPKDSLRVRIGWAIWSLMAAKRVRDSINAIDIAQAEAFDAADKKMIDKLVLKSFGSFACANTMLRNR